MIVLKYGVSLIFSIVVTTSLFYFMQYLILSGDSVVKADKYEVLVDFVRIEQERDLFLKNRKPKPPKIPDEPPPALPKQQFEVAVEEAAWSINQTVELDSSLEMAHGNFVADGDYLPIVKVQPTYPQRALARALIGWVMVTFTVNEQGMVVKPTVIDNCVMRTDFETGQADECVDKPGITFDRAALKAASRFKYKPKVINGLPVATTGVLNKITFTIDG